MIKEIIIGGVCGVIGYKVGHWVTVKGLMEYIKSDEAKNIMERELKKVLSEVHYKRDKA